MPMTYEDEEFNRIEMESRIRQEGVRAMSQIRTWVELTDQELVDLRDRVQKYTPIDSVKYGEAIQRAMNSALKEKNA